VKFLREAGLEEALKSRAEAETLLGTMKSRVDAVPREGP
jgi:hypothetical protein